MHSSDSSVSRELLSHTMTDPNANDYFDEKHLNPNTAKDSRQQNEGVNMKQTSSEKSEIRPKKALNNSSIDLSSDDLSESKGSDINEYYSDINVEESEPKELQSEINDEESELSEEQSRVLSISESFEEMTESLSLRLQDARDKIANQVRLTVDTIQSMEDEFEDSPSSEGLDPALKGVMRTMENDYTSETSEFSSPGVISETDNYSSLETPPIPLNPTSVEPSIQSDKDSVSKNGELSSLKHNEIVGTKDINSNYQEEKKFDQVANDNQKVSEGRAEDGSFLLKPSNSIPLVLSFQIVLKRFLKVFILTYGFRSTLSIVGSFFSELRRIAGSKNMFRYLLSRDFIKHVLVHESRAPYEAAMRIGLFCAGICSLFEGSEMIIRWIWYKVLKRDQELIKNQRIVFQIEKPKSQEQDANAGDSVAIIQGDAHSNTISTTPRGEEVTIVTKTKMLEYAPRIPWHTLIAGFVSGLALNAVQDPESKRTTSLYFFARFLQCVYNALKKKGHFNKILPEFAHYDSLLFMLSSAQIMYAWIARRFALPASYARFITKTGPIDQPVLDVVEAIHTPGSDVAATIPNLTKYLHKFYSSEKVKDITDGILQTHRVECNTLHPMEASCTRNFGRVTSDVARKIFPLYGVLTLVSLVLLKRNKILTSPGKTIGYGLFNVCRSTAFLSFFVSLYQYFVCGERAITWKKEHRFLYWLAGMFASSAIFIEQKSRRSELALYVLPRGLDALYLILQRRRWLSSVKQGELLLFCLSLSGIMYSNFHEKDTLGSLPRFILKTFFSNQIVKWIE